VYKGIYISQRRLLGPLYGVGRESVAAISRENPAEMINTYDVRPGQLEMFIGYGGRDQFNIDAQVESFLFLASQRGLQPTVIKVPDGKHDSASVRAMVPTMMHWLMDRLGQYSPRPNS
jgi:hypothetical protein